MNYKDALELLEKGERVSNMFHDEYDFIYKCKSTGKTRKVYQGVLKGNVLTCTNVKYDITDAEQETASWFQVDPDVLTKRAEALEESRKSKNRFLTQEEIDERTGRK